MNIDRLRPKNWQHDRTSFFKYANHTAAHAILDSCTLRWSSPRVFNDPFDMQFDLFVDLNEERVRGRTIELLRKAFYTPEGINSENPFGQSIKKFKSAFPKLSRDDFEREFSAPIREMCRLVPTHVAELNQALQAGLRDTKLLCLSERCDSILMWSHYAQMHEGVVFELACVPELDSVWGAAMPVNYMEDMPAAFDDDSLIRLASGQGHSSPQALLDKFVTAKAQEWAYEHEWRVVLHFTDPNQLTQDIRFSPKELAAIYLGCRMSDIDKNNFIAKIRTNYANAKIFAAEKTQQKFALNFREL